MLGKTIEFWANFHPQHLFITNQLKKMNSIVCQLPVDNINCFDTERDWKWWKGYELRGIQMKPLLLELPFIVK